MLVVTCPRSLIIHNSGFLSVLMVAVATEEGELELVLCGSPASYGAARRWSPYSQAVGLDVGQPDLPAFRPGQHALRGEFRAYAVRPAMLGDQPS